MMAKAIKSIKTQAYKQEADTIIEFKIENQIYKTSGDGINSFFCAYASDEQAIPVVKGWAIKWIQ